MSERETWNDEDFQNDGNNDSGEVVASNDNQAVPETQTTQQAAATAQTQDRDTERNATKHATAASHEDTGSRGAKRAQRTRRIKVTPGGQVSAVSPRMPTPSEGDKSAEVEQAPVNYSARQTAQNNEKKAPSESITGPSTPITIPPQLRGFQNPDNAEEILDFSEEDSSRLLDGINSLAEALRVFLARIRVFIVALFQAVGKVLMFPALFGGLLYFGLVYLLGTYILGTDDVTNVTGVEASLKFVLLSAGWTVMPVFSAFVVIHFATNGTKHHQFLYESMIDAMLQVFNGLIMSVHASPESLIWLAPVCIISCVFRLLYWVSLFYLSNKWQHIFKTPALVNSIMFSTNNLGASLRNCVRGHSSELSGGSEPGLEGSTEIPNADTATKDQGWF